MNEAKFDFNRIVNTRVRFTSGRFKNIVGRVLGQYSLDQDAIMIQSDNGRHLIKLAVSEWPRAVEILDESTVVTLATKEMIAELEEAVRSMEMFNLRSDGVKAVIESLKSPVR